MNERLDLQNDSRRKIVED